MKVLLVSCILLVSQLNQCSSMVITKSDAAEKDVAYKKLLQVFGVEDPGAHRNPPPPPPQYMLDLYHSIADPDGITRAPNPYHAKIIRSFTEKEWLMPASPHLAFNITGLGASEHVLEAELHIYRLRNEGPQPHKVTVYQVMDPAWVKEPEKNRVVDWHYVSNPSSGWEVFRVRSAIEDWLHSSQANHGFLVVATTASADVVDVRFSRRVGNRQPVLVLFNDEPSHPWGKTDSEDYKDAEMRSEVAWRTKRSTTSSSTTECRKAELYVDFERIGWSSWIISPKGYNAYHCTGQCTFPLGQSQRPTNHATVQSIVHELGLATGVSRPCCVPSRLLSLSLLYYDDNENVVLKQYDDMVADSCGCH